MLEKRIKDLKSAMCAESKVIGARSLSPLTVIADLIAGLAVGVIAGYWSDSFFETMPLFLFIFSILGVVAGIYNAYTSIVKK